MNKMNRMWISIIVFVTSVMLIHQSNTQAMSAIVLTPTPRSATPFPTVFSLWEYPTATNSPALATAIANSECYQSFYAYAFEGPVNQAIPRKALPLHWQVALTSPIQVNATTAISLDAAIVGRSYLGKREIWFVAKPAKPNRRNTIIAIYQPDSQHWEILPTQIGNTDLYPISLFVTQDGSVWGTPFNSISVGMFPVLSKFNEATRRFEFVKGVPENSEPYTVTRVSDDRAIWMFSDRDGIYRYDLASQSTYKQVEMPDVTFTGLAMFADKSIYLAMKSSTFPSRNGSFRFITTTNEMVSLHMPPEMQPIAEWGSPLVDHSDKLWFSANLYVDSVDGSLHRLRLVDEYLKERNGLIMWALPSPVFASSDGRVWFSRYLDAGGEAEGLAWYDPQIGEGCQFTNQLGNLVEDSSQQMWLIIDGKAYTYQLKH